MPEFKIFVINLERSPERLVSMQKQLAQQGYEFERIDALDGKLVDDNFIEQHSPEKLVKKSYYRPLSKGEVACSLSHQKAWQKIIDDQLDFAIVLEDDLTLLDNFSAVVSLVSTLPSTGWDFIKLFPLTRAAESNIDQSFNYKSHTFVTYHKFPLGCQGQVISRQGALALMKNMPYVKEPVDSQLKSWWELDILPFGLLPYCIATEIGGESDINPEGKLEQIKQNKFVKAINKVTKAFQRLRWQAKLRQRFKLFTRSLPTA